MKKNGFLTFIFALIPGAGQMYMGLMKRGAVLLTCFTGLIFASSYLYIDFAILFMPVLWFYSFFDTFRLRNLSAEEREKLNASFSLGDGKLFGQGHFKKKYFFLGIGSIFIGAYIIFNRLLKIFIWDLANTFPIIYRIINSLPSIIVAVAIIIAGLYLLTGAGKRKAKNDEYKELKDNER